MLPFRDIIQARFGRHDVSSIRAHTGGAAAEASRGIGASAYAMGESVAFGRSPDLHTAAHEAAHVIQQRAGVSLSGGVGQAGDAYERQADAVADAVVRGGDASALLQFAPTPLAATRAVQLRPEKKRPDARSKRSVLDIEKIDESPLNLDEIDESPLNLDEIDESPLNLDEIDESPYTRQAMTAVQDARAALATWYRESIAATKWLHEYLEANLAKFAKRTGGNVLMDFRRQDLQDLADSLGWPIEFLLMDAPVIGGSPPSGPAKDLTESAVGNGLQNLATAIPNNGVASMLEEPNRLIALKFRPGAQRGESTILPQPPAPIGAWSKALRAGGSILAAIGLSVLWDHILEAFTGGTAKAYLDAYGDGHAAGVDLALSLVDEVNSAAERRRQFLDRLREDVVAQLDATNARQFQTQLESATAQIPSRPSNRDGLANALTEVWLRQHAGDDEDENLDTSAKYWDQARDQVGREGTGLEKTPKLFVDQLRYFVVSNGLEPEGSELDWLREEAAAAPDDVDQLLKTFDGRTLLFTRARNPDLFAARVSKWLVRGTRPLEPDGDLPSIDIMLDVERDPVVALNLAAHEEDAFRVRVELDLTSENGTVFVHLYHVQLTPGSGFDEDGEPKKDTSRRYILLPRRDVVSPDTPRSGIVRW